MIRFSVRRLAGGYWAKGSWGTQAIGTWAPTRAELAQGVRRAVAEMKRLWIYPRGLRVII
jgi:hypothetical protein